MGDSINFATNFSAWPSRVISVVTPHGINQRGQSIIGQPDSYVGISANSCSIAFEYSTQKEGWKRKLIEDVANARASCPDAKEIVVSTCIDVDRNRLGSEEEWEQRAKEAAHPATLTVFGGRLIAQLLDTRFQQLRYRYLDIPCSQLSGEAILASCQRWNDRAIERLILQGRYFPQQYVSRKCDTDLYRIWQLATDIRLSSDRAPLIPIVGDSGLGKSSSVAQFVETLNRSYPTILLQARDIEFSQDDALIRSVLSSVHGIVDGANRRTEEAAIVGVLSDDRTFTIVVDGLDEASDPMAVRRAISRWLSSSIGGHAVMVVTSRPDFWQRCREPSWSRHLISLVDVCSDSIPKRPVEPEQVATMSLMREFTTSEALAAWKLSGRTEEEFFLFSDSVRSELRHPFTLHAASDLIRSGATQTDYHSRTEIMEKWIDLRLSAESHSTPTRISPQILREVLVLISAYFDEHSETWIRVDQLQNLSGINTSRVAEQAIDILLNSDLLEARDEFGVEIRFTVESVQEFFSAEGQLAKLRSDPHAIADAFKEIRFTDAEIKLDLLGKSISRTDVGDEFLVQIAEHDPWKAAIVLRANPDEYLAKNRRRVISFLGEQLESRYECRRAKAAEMLGLIDCIEAGQCLATHAPRSKACSESMRETVALSATRISHSQCVEHVFECSWFRRAGFFLDIRSFLVAATSEFRQALGDYAAKHLDFAQRPDHHFRAISVLAYLRDPRVIDGIEELMRRSVRPKWYEISALLNFRCERSARIYADLVRAASPLRSLLATCMESGKASDDHRISHDVSTALGTLRDPAAVGVLLDAARAGIGLTSMHAVDSLARIRTGESAKALLELAELESDHKDNDKASSYRWFAGVLVGHGSTECVAMAVQMASKRSDGIRWLMEAASQTMTFRTHARWRFYTHVDSRPLIEIVAGGFRDLPTEDQLEIVRDFHHFDGDRLREFLREVAHGEFAANADAQEELAVRDAAMRALSERGDSTSTSRTIEKLLCDKQFANSYGDRDLQNFAPQDLLKELTSRLTDETDSTRTIRLLRLIGEFGTSGDAHAIAGFLESDDPSVANAACETATRLSDPRLLPEDWS